MTRPGASFKENLQTLPGVSDLARIDLTDDAGTVVASILNEPGKQGSLAVYQHLQEKFGALTAEAARYGLELFAEHTADAKNRPGAHPNIDRLLAILDGGPALQILLIRV